MQIEATVAVYVRWNDDANEWEMHPCMTTGGDLDWAGEDGLPTAPGGVGWVPDLVATEAMLDRAGDHHITAEDLARMLGSAITQPGPNKNLQKGYRPASNGLIHMIEGAIEDAFQAAPHRQRDALVQQLVPIFASVDQNAHDRGRAEGLAPTLSDAERARLRNATDSPRQFDEVCAEVRAILGGRAVAK